MALIATEEQKRELNDNGFTVIENLLTEAEVATLDDAIEEVSLRRDQAADLPALSRPGSTGTGFLAMRNGILQHPALLDLVDRPDILSYVVDMVGWNIQNRDSVLLRTPPEPEAVDHGRMGLGWHFDYEEEFGGITRGDPMPLIDFKVGWYRRGNESRNEKMSNFSLLGFFAKHKTAANLLMVFLIVSGLLSLQRLNRQLFPDLNVEIIVISVFWAGASAEDVDKNIAQTLVPDIRPLSGVKKVRSTSSENLSVMQIEYEFGSNMQTALSDVEAIVNAADFSRLLPQPRVASL
mgnify:CR=1 FL=1